MNPMTLPIILVRVTTTPLSLRLLLTGQPAYMKKSGFEVALISSDGQDWESIEGAEECMTYKIGIKRQISPWRDIKTLWKLIHVFRKLQPQIVHSHTPKAGLLAMLAARWCKVPVRIHTLAGMPMTTATGVKKVILRWTEMLTYACSHETWINSGELKDFVIKDKMIHPGKAHMILNGSSNGIDLAKYSVDSLVLSKLQSIKEKWAITSGQFVFIAIGRLVKDKGIAELVEAFVMLEKKYTNIRLLLLGTFEHALDPLPERIINEIEQNKHITLVPWNNEVEYYLHLSQCFVHASHREGFPNVVLQAGAMECPVICSAIPGNVDIVQRQSEGYLFPREDVSRLSVLMEHVMNNYSEAKEKAAVLRQKIRTNFERNAVHQAIKERYVELLTKKKIDVSAISETGY